MPPAHEPLKFFISYARADAAFVIGLARDLRAMDVPLWLDQLDIQGGERWDLAIERALASSRGMIVALSPDAIASTTVMDEISYALDEGKALFPVLVKACAIPFRLRRVQRIDFCGDYQAALQRLYAALGGLSLANADSANPPAPTGAEEGVAAPEQGATPTVPRSSKAGQPPEHGPSASTQGSWQGDLVEFDETFLADEQPKSQVLIEHMLQVLREKGWEKLSVARVEFCLNEIVDNAFSHGIANVSAGKVQIRAFLTSDRSDFRISDTGPGFDLSAQVGTRDLAKGLVQVFQIGDLKQVGRNTLDLRLVNQGGHGTTQIPKTQIRKVGDVDIFEWNGRIDHSSADLFQHALNNIEWKNGARVAIDLSRVDYISSVGLRVLMVFAKMVIREKAGRIVLFAPPPILLEVLTLGRMHLVFPIVSSQEEALARLLDPAG